MRPTIFLLLLSLSAMSFWWFAAAHPNEKPEIWVLDSLRPLPNDKLKGMALVAPPRAFAQDPMLDLKTLGVNWLSLHPYAFFSKNKASIAYNMGHQWWGETPEGIRTSIQLAKANGLKVLLKPQLWAHNLWTGDLVFDQETDWENWQKDYRHWILGFADMADSLGVEMLCVGTELDKIAAARPDFWVDLIAEIRLRYKGKLTYAANWDSFESISFWKLLDYVGVDAYFPLSTQKTPNVAALLKAWLPHKRSLEAHYQQHKVPMLFTEFGYLSVDACAHRNWELEKSQHINKINEQAQANALHALLESFGNEPWWAGGFQWKWYPNGLGNEGEGDFEKDYTPQKKLAEQVLKRAYLGEKK